MLLLKNATVYPQTEKAPFVGDVLCENGRIKEIGKDLSADDAETIDLTGLNLLPGIVDCHSHAGLGPNGDVATLSYCTDTANPVSPEMDVIYAADPTNGCYRWAIENGVTTLGILPGSCDVIDGTGFATRTWGSNIFEMCLKRNICMKLSLGENPKGMFQNKNMEPDSRMGVTFILEEYFANAKAYMDKKDRGEKVDYNEQYEVAIPVLKREIPARIHCTHNDMAAAIQCLSKYNLRFTIEHAWGSSNYLDEIVASGCGIVYGPIGGRFDAIMMRVLDSIMCIPSMMMALAIVAALGSSLVNVLLAMTISNVPWYCRIIRSSVLGVTGQTYIEAARSCGTSDFQIIMTHVLPNAMGPIIVQATMGIGGAIISAAGISFVGMGIQPPAPEWGAMLNEAKTFMTMYPYMVVFPGLAIGLTALSMNLMGDGLRDALDPKLKD